MLWYNGFTPRERRLADRAIRVALADERMNYAATCSVCMTDLLAPHQWHLERYDIAHSAFPVCRRCHNAVHARFRHPSSWRALLSALPPDNWVQALTLDPASLSRPYCETYPNVDLVFTQLTPVAGGRLPASD